MDALITKQYFAISDYYRADESGLGYLVTDISRLLRQRVQGRLVGGEVTLAKAKVLVYVQRFTGIHQTELAMMLEMQLSQLVKLVDQLIEGDLLSRKPDPIDRRAYQLYLAPTADKYLNDLNAILSQVDDEALNGFTESEKKVLSSALLKLRSNLLNKS